MYCVHPATVAKKTGTNIPLCRETFTIMNKAAVYCHKIPESKILSAIVCIDIYIFVCRYLRFPFSAFGILNTGHTYSFTFIMSAMIDTMRDANAISMLYFEFLALRYL